MPSAHHNLTAMSACCHDLAGGVGEERDASATQDAPQHWLRFAIAVVLAGLSMQFSLGVNLSPVVGPTTTTPSPDLYGEVRKGSLGEGRDRGQS